MKSIFSSKTLWVGLGQFVFGVVGLFTGWIESSIATTLVFTGLAMMGLRLNTSQPVGL